MDINRRLILALMFLLTLNFSLGLIGEISDFTDGADKLNFTLNTTDYLAIPKNSAVLNASLTLTPRKYVQYNSSYATSSFYWGISKIPNTNDYYATDGSTKTVYRLNSTFGQISNFTYNVTNLIPLFYQPINTFYGIHAVDNDTLYVVTHDTNNETYNSLIKINYSKGEGGAVDLIRFVLGYPNERINDSYSLYVDDSETYAYVTSASSSDYDYFYKINISNCGNPDLNCYTTFDFSTDKYSLPNNVNLNEIDSPDNGTTIFGTTSAKIYKYVNYEFSEVFNLQQSFNSTLDGSIIILSFGIDITDTQIFLSETWDQDEIAQFRYNYPEKVKIFSNKTVLYNNSAMMTEEVTVHINKTPMQDYASNSFPTEIEFSALYWGAFNISDLYVRYNATNSAIVTITPSELTGTKITGQTYSVSLNITNSGDYNASNITLETVSSYSTPNYNATMTFDCEGYDIGIDESILCNVTFPNLQTNPEVDERLRVIIRNGTIDGDQIYSNSVDIDIIVVEPSDSTTGSGGSSSQETETMFDIVGVNAFNQDTVQLSIRPATERDFCLDVINLAETTQVIYMECDLPSGQDKDVCSWLEYYCEDTQSGYSCREISEGVEITVQPQEELRARFCMKINPSFDVAIGERYIANVKGTVVLPNNMKGNTDVHSITMWVTDPSLFLQNFFEKLQDTNIMDSFYAVLKQYIKEDINTFSIKNWQNPFIILIHILMLILIFSLLKKQKILIHVMSQIIIIVFNILALYYPLVLLIEYLIVGLMLVWSLILSRLIK